MSNAHVMTSAVPAGGRPTTATDDLQDRLAWETAMDERPRPHEAGRHPRLTRLVRESAYLLLAWPILLAGFIAVLTVLAVGVPLVVVWIGLPIIAVALLLARLVAMLERATQAAFLDQEVPPAAYRSAPEGASLLNRITLPYRDAQCWADVGFALLAWIVSTVTWSLTLLWWGAAVVGFIAPIITLFDPGDARSYVEIGGIHSHSIAVSIVIDLLTGLAAAASLPWVIHALARMQSVLFGAILGAGALQRRVATLETSRRAAHEAEASALHRLERDLHDGPQQRLVRLQMDLGRALHQLDADPTKARAALESSLDQARGTLADLRDLSRGIAPPILADRGLVAALDELTARSAIPTTFTTGLSRDRRPDEIPDRVQHACFYLVSEALTNAAKHGGASAAHVDVQRAAEGLVVQVRDDGAGGARIVDGGGLAGLRDRVAGLDGTLSLDSPAGGPTVLTAVLPCD